MSVPLFQCYCHTTNPPRLTTLRDPKRRWRLPPPIPVPPCCPKTYKNPASSPMIFYRTPSVRCNRDSSCLRDAPARNLLTGCAARYAPTA